MHDIGKTQHFKHATEAYTLLPSVLRPHSSHARDVSQLRLIHKTRDDAHSSEP